LRSKKDSDSTESKNREQNIVPILTEPNLY